MAINNQSIYRQVYNAHTDDTNPSLTEQAVCVVTRRGMATACFDAGGELISIHYVGYQADRPVWELDFFEALFEQEPLKLHKTKVSKVFVCTDRNLVVPGELYDKVAAAEWFRAIHFAEKNDAILDHVVTGDALHYTWAMPVYISKLFSINCPRAVVLPLALYQLTQHSGQREQLQCFVGAEQACVSWYKNNQLFWHKVFDYASAEDIAYEIRLVCEEHKINASRLDMALNTMSGREYPVANGLSQYFNSVYTGNGKAIRSLWDPSVSLFQQLLSCA